MYKKRVLAILLSALILLGTVSYAAVPASGAAPLRTTTQVEPAQPGAAEDGVPQPEEGPAPEAVEGPTGPAVESAVAPAEAEAPAAGDVADADASATPPDGPAPEEVAPEDAGEVADTDEGVPPLDEHAPETESLLPEAAESSLPQPDAGSSVPAPETVAPEEDPPEGGETRSAPSITLPEGSETLSFYADETKTIQLTVADAEDAPGAVRLTADCDNPALFDAETLLTDDGDGAWTLSLAPLGGATGVATITLTATNTADMTETATLTVTVTQRNRAPVFTPPGAPLAVDEDTPLGFDLGGYFSDPDGDALSYTVTTQAEHGTAAVAGAQLTYTPAPDYDQTDRFTVTASDGALTVAGVFEIVITPADDAPVAVDDTAAATTAGGAITIDVLANDRPVNSGASLVITGVTSPAAGSAEVVDDGQRLRYTPTPRQAPGEVAFQYTVRHSDGTLEATAEVRVTVSYANSAPVILELPATLAGTEGVPLEFGFTVRDVDIPSPPEGHLTLEVASDNGAILKAGGISYTATYVDDDTVRFAVRLVFETYANTDPADGYGTLTLTVTVGDKDDAASKASQQVAVSVAPVDDPPEIRQAPDTFNMNEDSSDGFTFEVYDPDMPLAAGDPGYTVTALSDTAAVLPNSSANVQVAFVSKAEGARTAVYRVTLTPLPDANTHQAAYAEAPVGLTLSVTDRGANSDTHMVAVDVAQVNDAPTARNLSYHKDEDTVITIGVAEAGFDADGMETIRFHVDQTDSVSDAGGSIAIAPDGKTLTYTPAQYYHGSDKFRYTIIDDALATSPTRTVSITLDFVNYPPRFTNLQAQPYETNEDTPVDIELHVFDVETPAEAVGMQVSLDANADLIASYRLEAVDDSQPTRRVLHIVPADNRNNTGGRNARFKLVLGDGTVNATFYLELEIAPVNDAPKAGTLEKTFTEDVPITIYGTELLAICSDVDKTLGEDDDIYIRAANLGTPAHGGISQLVIDGDGNVVSFLYTPDQYFDGEDEISFVVQDKLGAIGHGKIKLTAIPVNNVPTLGAIGDVTMDEDGTAEVEISFFDAETPRENLILAVASGDTSVLNKDSFTIVQTPTGCKLTIKPRQDQFSEAGVVVSFTVSDGQNSVSESFTVVVRSVPDAPKTPDLAYTVRDATTLVLDPLSECTDPDPDDEMTLVSLLPDPPAGGVLEDMGGGLYGYTSEPNYAGTVVLEYTVKDKYDLTSTGTITITVSNTDIGASIDKLPPLIFFAGQQVPTYTLTIQNVNAGRAYDLKAEALGGGPVNSSSLKLDGGGSTLHVANAGASPQQHTLNFALYAGVIGDSVVRMTITYVNEQGETEEGMMSFKVTANRDNDAPVAEDHPDVDCDEDSSVLIDVLSKVTDKEDPLMLQMQIQAAEIVAGSKSAGTVTIVQDGGRWKLRFADGGNHNAHNDPSYSYVVEYTVVDSGGKTDSAQVRVNIHSTDHRPYTNAYVRTLTLAEATAAQLDLTTAAHDYDGDVLELHSVTPVTSGEGTDYTANVAGGKLNFSSAVPGWYELSYRVQSTFKNTPPAPDNATLVSNEPGSVVLIGVLDPDGKISPYFRSRYVYISEDDAEQAYDLTDYVYASSGKDVTLSVNTAKSLHLDKLETYALEKTGSAGNYQYTLKIKPKENANSNGGSPQIAIDSFDNISQAGSDPEKPGRIYVHIYPVNDAPVMDAPATLNVDRGYDTTFTVNITDVDYPVQTACDAQIRLSLLSSNDNIVNSEASVIAAPTDVPGRWSITVRGMNAGNCTLTLTASDNGGGSCEKTVAITVTAQNRVPVAKDYYAVFDEDSKAAVTVYDEESDEDGDPLTIALGDVSGLPGRAAVEGDKITFMPNADYCHDDIYTDASGGSSWTADQYVEIPYTLNDLESASVPAVVRIHFNPVNDAPRYVALTQNHTMDEGQTGIIKLRVTDVDSLQLDFACTWETADDKIDGIVLTKERLGAAADGKGSIYEVTLSVTNKLYAYHANSEPATGITVTASDGVAAPVVASLLLTISPTNDTPVLKSEYRQPLELETNEDTPLSTALAGCYWDPDGDNLYIISLTGAEHGKVSNVGGKALFEPDADYFTADVLDEAQYGWYNYVITDGFDEVAGRARVLIKPVNDAPRLKAATRDTDEDTPVTIDLWSAAPEDYKEGATIWDVDNAESELSIATVGTVGSGGTDGKTAGGGTVTVENGRLIRYSPALDFYGADSFRYVVSDGAASSFQTVTVNVRAVDDKPRANFEGSASWCPAPAPRVEVQPGDIPTPCWAFDEDDTGRFAFRVWDPEGNGVLVTYTTTAEPNLLPESRITLGGSGENLVLNMTPMPDQYGSFTITFTLNDGKQTQSYTIPVQVRPVNDLPEIDDAAITVAEDGVWESTMTATDVEDEATALVFALADDILHPLPQHGTAVVQPGGAYSYTPDADYYGADVFYIMVTDSEGGTSYAEISVTVTPVNDAPTAPTALSFDAAHYGDGAAAVLSWTAGEDLPNETARADLRYDVEISFDGGATWPEKVLQKGAVSYDGAGGCSTTLPGTLLAGKNTAGLVARVRTWDNGHPQAASFALPSASWAQAGPVKVDSTPPTATHTLEKSSYTNADVTITLAPADKTPDAAWQAGVSHVVAPAGVTVVDAGNYTYKTATNGSFVFELYDLMGNKREYTVPVAIIDRVFPQVVASPTGIAAGAGKVVGDDVAITLSYTDPADPDTATPAENRNVVSGLKTKRYKLVRNGTEPAEWTAYTGPIALELKGSYTILVQAEDKAGNLTESGVNMGSFGPYVVNNSAPVAEARTVHLYRQDIANSTTKKMTQALTLAASDDDIEDTLAYRWDTSEQAYTDLASYVDLTGSGTAWTLTHKGGALADDLNDLSFTLHYTAEDDDASDPRQSAPAAVTVVLHPVNAVPGPPQEPVTPAAATLKGGASFTLGWDAGSDVETAQNALRYRLRWRTSNSDAAWSSPVTTAAGATGHTLTLPTVNTEFFQFEICTLDDNPASRINPDGSMGNALSVPLYSPVYRIDAKAPVVGFTQTPLSSVWTNGSVDVTVNISDSGTGQAGLAEVKLNGSTEADYASPGTGSYTLTQTATLNDTAYTYVVTDHVGNSTTKTHTVTNIDTLKPAVSADLTHSTVPGYAAQPIEVNLSYTDAAAVTGQSGSSGVPAAQMWVRWYEENSPPADANAGYKLYTDKITFNVRGKYYIDAWCVDNAANESDVAHFGPYEIANSAPTANPVAVTLYEHNVAGVGSASVDIVLSATDLDGDGIGCAFTDTTALGGWGTLTKKSGTDNTWTLTHDGSEFASASVALEYKAEDDFNGALSAAATVTVTLVPVNDAPGVPGNFALDTAGPYAGGQSVTLSWTAGSDDETGTGALAYVLSWPDGAGGWLTQTTAAGATSATVAIPAGVSTSTYEFRIQTKDDNPNTVYNPDGSTGPAMSGLVRIQNVAVDSAPPTATHTLQKNTWTNDDVTITLAPADKTPDAAWQAGFDRVVPPAGVTVVDANNYIYKTATNGSFVFELYDLAGNKGTHTVAVEVIDRIAPQVTASPGSIPASDGKRVTDNLSVTLTWADPADPDTVTPPANRDKVSGLKSKAYKLVRDGVVPASWTAYTGPIALDLKGSYSIMVRAEDNAGNVTESGVNSVPEFGPYVVNNSVPTVGPQAHTVYEHTVGVLPGSVSIQLAGQDADTEDMTAGLRFAWDETNADYIRLTAQWGTMTLTGAAGSGRYTFAHSALETEDLPAADRVFRLPYTATDKDGLESQPGVVTITLVPVNHRPTAPKNPAAAATLYRQGDAVSLNWGAGSDVETAAASLRYDVEVTLDGSLWTALPGSPFSATTTGGGLTAPAGNSAVYRFRVRTRDTNPAGTGNIDEVTGAAITGVSAWVMSPAYKLDNTPPTATHTTVPADDTGGDVVVTLTPRDANPAAAWQSGIDRVEAPNVPGLAVHNAAKYQYRISRDGSYVFNIVDKAGNRLAYTVTTGVPADPVISYTTTHTRRGQKVAVSWTHPTDTAHYELQVDDGSGWRTLLASGAGYTAKDYSYAVPGTAADTADMRFRVRAWDAAGLHSANWAVGPAIICDTSRPAITLVPTVENSVFTNQSVTVAVTVTDPLAKLVSVTVQQNGVGVPVLFNPAAGQYTASVVFAENGRLNVSAMDACGNAAATSYTVTNIDKTPPEVTALVTCQGEAYTGRVSHPLHFAMAFADAGVSGMASSEYAITDSAAAPTDWIAVTSGSAEETRSELGAYHLHLRASDHAGNVTYQYAGLFEIYNTIPVMENQTEEVDEGAFVDITLKAKENDPGDYITKWEIVTEPQYGQLTDLGGGRFRYTHDGVDPIADDFFTYFVEDTRDGVSGVARVDIRVLEVNDPPFIHNLPGSVDIGWNTTTPVPFDIADADDLAGELQWFLRCAGKAVLPLSGVHLQVVPRADGHEADVVLNLTPAQDAFTEPDSPVLLVLRVWDAGGLQDEKQLWVNVVRGAQPPKAEDQYHFVVPGGTVRGAVQATPDYDSAISHYEFGAPGNSSQCSLACTPDGSFSLTAADDFVSDAFPVRVHDANGQYTDITVYVSSQAVSRENMAVDRLVSSIPTLADVDHESATVTVESSSAPDILPVENCDLVLGEGGELQLYYNPVEHRYGELTLTLCITAGDGTMRRLSIPVSIRPVNDAPAVANRTKSPLKDGVYDVYLGENMTGQLEADDSLDAVAYQCTDFAFSCLPGHAPEFGTLELGADGSYTYTPNDGFEGEDEFCITVSERTGWAENQNPAALPAGVVDVSDGVPLLARVVHVQLRVCERPEAPPPPKKPDPKPNKPEDPDSTPPSLPAQTPPPDSGSAQPPASVSPAPPAESAAESGAQSAATGNAGAPPTSGPAQDDPPEPPNPPDESQPLELTEHVVKAAQPGWVWPVAIAGAAVLLVLLWLLLSCRIRVVYAWRDADGQPHTHKRTLWFRRIRQGGDAPRRLDISTGETGPLAGVRFRLRFGPLYRRGFYGQGIWLDFDGYSLLATIPEKAAYREDGLKAAGADFTPETEV